MPFKKGQSGNPNGRPKRQNTLADAIREILDAKGEDGRTKREAIIDTVVVLALNGEMRAIEFIRDSVDGKPAQTLKHEGDEQNPVWVTVRGPGEVS